MSLQLFMKDLLGSNGDDMSTSSFTIVDDNAKLPSEVFLLGSRLDDSFLSSSDLSFNIVPKNHNTSRVLSRHHSEPIRIHPLDESSTGDMSRWEGSTMGTNKGEKCSDPSPVMPKRTQDRWSVCRNHSDSFLMKAPKRRGRMTATSSVLSSLQRKVSASKVISEMAHSSLVRGNRHKLHLQQESSKQSNNSNDHSESFTSNNDMLNNDIIEDPESLIEQLIEIPNSEQQRRRKEGTEKFIRSILDTTIESDDESAECDSSNHRSASHHSSLSSSKNLKGMFHVVMGFFSIALRVISVEVIQPTIQSWTDYLHRTLVVVLPKSIMPNTQNKDDGKTGTKDRCFVRKYI